MQRLPQETDDQYRHRLNLWPTENLTDAQTALLAAKIASLPAPPPPVSPPIPPVLVGEQAVKINLLCLVLIF